MFGQVCFGGKYYAYNGPSLGNAVGRLKTDYLILNDRVMVKGIGHGKNEWTELCAAANTFARKHGVLVGCVSNSFYGNLDVYRVRYPVDEAVEHGGH